MYIWKHYECKTNERQILDSLPLLGRWKEMGCGTGHGWVLTKVFRNILVLKKHLWHSFYHTDKHVLTYSIMHYKLFNKKTKKHFSSGRHWREYFMSCAVVSWLCLSIYSLPHSKWRLLRQFYKSGHPTLKSTGVMTALTWFELVTWEVCIIMQFHASCLSYPSS